MICRAAFAKRGVPAALVAVAALATLAALALLPRFATYRAHPLAAALLAGAGLALALAPRGARALGRISRAVGSVSPVAFGLFLFVAGTLFYALVSWRVFGALPVLDDDACALMQARVFLSGRVTMPLPDPPECFRLHFWLDDQYGLPHMCAMYPPGHPALLALGLAVGAPWLVMPVLGGLLAVLVASVGRLLFDEESARLAGLFCVVSPMVCELSATHLAHVPAACGLLLAARGVLRCLERPSWADGALAGLGIALSFQCRTADAVVAGFTMAVPVLASPGRAWRARGPLALAALILALSIAGQAWYWSATTQDWRTPGHVLALGERGRIGFFADYTPAMAVRRLFVRLGELNGRVLGWPVPTFLPAVVPLFFRPWRLKALWLWSVPAAMLAFLAFFWGWEQPYLPASYAFASVPALLLLSAAGVSRIARRLSVPALRILPPVALPALLLFLPAHLRSFDDHFWNMEKTLPRVVRAAGVRNAVVLCDAIDLHPRTEIDIRYDFFARAFLMNALPFESGDVVFVRNLRNWNDRVFSRFPGRRFFLYRFNRRNAASELYRIDFEDGEPVYRFVALDLPRYPKPDGRRSIPSAPVVPPDGPSKPSPSP